MDTRPRIKEFVLSYAYLILLAAWVLATVALFAGYFDQRQKTRDLAQQALELAQRNNSLARQIQQQRREAIRLSCENQNNRHKDLEAFLIEQGQSQQENPALFVFIDKLAPLQDCNALVRRLTRTN